MGPKTGKAALSATGLAPCGLHCELCLGFQREKNRCGGCKGDGEKPAYCGRCSIRNCPEKMGDPLKLCDTCRKYPCRRLKDLDRRYRTRYGESLAANFEAIATSGLNAFLKDASAHWSCPACGSLLCVHRPSCPACGATNPHHPGGGKD